MQSLFRFCLLPVCIVLSTNGCSPQYEASDLISNETNSPTASEVDPSAYTLSAELTVPSRYGSDGQIAWEDGQASFSLSTPVSINFPLRRTIEPSELQQAYKFIFTHQASSYVSDSIRFTECSALTKLGYKADDFRHTRVLYGFDQFLPQIGSTLPAVEGPTLYRSGSTLGDSQAVTCERALPVRPYSQLRMILTTTGPTESALRFSKNGTQFLPRSVTFSESLTKVRQTYEFIFPNGTNAASVNEAFTVISPSGSYDFKVSFQRCISTYPQAQEPPIFQEIELQQDTAGKPVESEKLECCFISGVCSAPN